MEDNLPCSFLHLSCPFVSLVLSKTSLVQSNTNKAMAEQPRLSGQEGAELMRETEERFIGAVWLTSVLRLGSLTSFQWALSSPTEVQSRFERQGRPQIPLHSCCSRVNNPRAQTGALTTRPSTFSAVHDMTQSGSECGCLRLRSQKSLIVPRPD